MRDVPLAALGGRGVFVDAIEEALRQKRSTSRSTARRILPSRVPSDLAIAAFLERADPRDVLVSRAGRLHELPLGARVGTSSLRRVSLLHAVRPDLDTVDLRGNVDTRLRKLDAGDYDAIMLAGAGLIRLGLADRVTDWLPLEAFPSSPGQGALAVETRADDAELHRSHPTARTRADGNGARRRTRVSRPDSESGARRPSARTPSSMATSGSRCAP